MKKITFLVSAVLLFAGSSFAQYYTLKGTGSEAPFTAQVQTGEGVTYKTLLSATAAEPTTDEKMSDNQAIPFTFNFYGNAEAVYKVSDNGYITFDISETPNSSNVDLPNAAAPKKAIFAFWDDLKTFYSTTVSSLVINYTVGTAPNRMHIIKWFNSAPKAATANDKSMIFAIGLKEQGGFEIIHESVRGTGTYTETATIGCQNVDGTEGITVGSDVAFPSGLVFPGQNDDVVYEFIEGVQPAKDAGISDINIPSQVIIPDGAVPLETNIRNFGSETLTSIDVTYTVDGGTPFTDNHTVSVAPGDIVTLTNKTAWTPPNEGGFTIEMSISNPNGGTDENADNDNKMSQLVAAYNKKYDRTPLYEIFTSSTCPPCAPGNANFHSIIDPVENECTYVKYQQDYPGTGDPYATAESITRAGYYSVDGVPNMQIDAQWDGNANFFTKELHDEFKSKFAFVKIDATYDKWATSVATNVTVEGLYNYPNVSIYALVYEKETTKNVKTNGETKFENVFKKWMTNGTQGDLINLAPNTPVSKSYTTTFRGDYRLPDDGDVANIINWTKEHSIEDFTDIGVLIFVQENGTKQLLNSVYATEVSAAINDKYAALEARVFPNPTTGVTNVGVSLLRNSDVSIEIVNATGQVVESNNFSNMPSGRSTMTVDLSGMTNGVYFVNIESNEGSTTKRIVLNN